MGHHLVKFLEMILCIAAKCYKWRYIPVKISHMVIAIIKIFVPGYQCIPGGVIQHMFHQQQTYEKAFYCLVIGFPLNQLAVKNDKYPLRLGFKNRNTGLRNAGIQIKLTITKQLVNTNTYVIFNIRDLYLKLLI